MKAYPAGMAERPSESVVRAWARLARAQHLVLSRIEADLKAVGLPPLAWYDVLLELNRAGAGAGGLRPFELERRLLLPQYGLSRLIDRIERAGCVERRPCAEDGRGQIVAITGAGRELRARMWPVYAAAIEAAVGAALSDAEAEHLAALLGKVIAAPER
jgi:DNA-binding MarR family transcriptional regulator